MKLKKEKGITLIALIVTIIILMILAGVSINVIFGQNGLISKAKWSAYVSEYGAVDEQKELYVGNYLVNKIGKKYVVTESYEIASLSTMVKTIDEKILMYPVNEKLDINSMYNSLKETIKQLENLNENDLQNEEIVNLYKVDFSKINANVKKSYAINIVSGMLYSIEYEEYGGMLYHTPKSGIDNTGDINSEIIERNITETGTYEIIVDAAQIVTWDSIEIQYYKYVENSLSMKVYTSDDEMSWTEETVQLGETIRSKKKYNIIEAYRTRYLKVEITIDDVNGENSELDYILVNFYKYKETDVTPEITTTAKEINGVYTVQSSTNGETEATGTATVKQKVILPTDSDEYMLEIKEWCGNPNTTVTITNADGTSENYTVSDVDELKKITIKPGATVIVNTTLNAGDAVGKVTVLGKESDISSEKKTTASEKVVSQDWRTVEQKKYIYNNGGSGYWEKCLVNEIEVDETGIIIESEDAVKRIRVRYQVLANGGSWSGYFTNIEQAENTQYIRVIVDYQVKGDIEYGDTSNNKIKVILNDGCWVATFLDEDGTELFKKKVYFENSNKQGTLILQGGTNNTADKDIVSWKIGDTLYEIGTIYTITADTEFTAICAKLNIYTASDLVEIRNLTNNGISFKGLTVNVMNDIDLSSVCSSTKGNWVPIGNDYYSKKFLGTFNGNNKIIKNLYINSSEASFAGLFGTVGDKAEIKNVILEGTIYVDKWSGGICGGITGGTVRECINKVTIQAFDEGVGGIAGFLQGGTIVNCKNEGVINGAHATGGIVGIVNLTTGTVTGCANMANVTGTYMVGGIIGRNSISTTVLNCYNIAEIKSTARVNSYEASVGGIVGLNEESEGIENCYNVGNVSASYQIVGGIVGFNIKSKKVHNVINAGTITKGTVTATANIGVSSNYVGYLIGCYGTVTGTALNTTKAVMKTWSDATIKQYLGNGFKKDTLNVNDGLPILDWQ